MSVPTTRRDLRVQAPASGALAVPSSAPRRRNGSGRLLVDVLLWIAALIGTVCIVLVILAHTAGITLIMFRTGSMSPTIPAGSVAVVQRIPAAEIAVGDVVTVDRDGELPITHRVTSVSAGDTPEERILTMRGDANADEDPFPYTVESVRIVRFAVPGVSSAVVAMANPLVLGGLTVAAAALVIWAF